MKILITCPPMIKRIDFYKTILDKYNMDYDIPEFTQTMSEPELIRIVGNYDGWIIGDDPATRKVLTAGKNGKLKSAVKWGVGVDNVDFNACKDLNIKIDNIPAVFGEEVSDIAIGYLICLSRDIHNINSEVRRGIWYKPSGVSLCNKKICLVGFGDIGRTTARKLLAFNMDVYVSDPGFEKINNKLVCKYNNNLHIDDVLNKIKLCLLNDALYNADFIIVTCQLNSSTLNLLNKNNLITTKRGVRIINVSRGQIINELDMIELLHDGHIDSVGLDVFENEPVAVDNELLQFKKNIFGSHNASNTIEAVDKVSFIAIDKLYNFMCTK